MLKIPPDQLAKFGDRRADLPRDPEPAKGEGRGARPRGPPVQVVQLPPYLTIKKAYETAGISRSKLYEIVGDGLVRAVKIGTKTLIDTGSLLSYLENLPAAQIKPPSKAKPVGTSA
jgi:excisionase family DNA binding protein